MTADLYDDPDMPMRDVTRVESVASPWGDDGKCWHLHLSCGCVLVSRVSRRPPKQCRCMGVHRLEQLELW